MARMKVLLTDDVPNLGTAGEVHAVAGGYARNYLMPRGFAVLATKGAMKQAEDIRQAGMRKRAQELANAQAQAEMINGKRLLFHARAGERDRLYGSVTVLEIAERLSEEVGFDVDRRKIELDQPIRELGIVDLSVRLVAEVTAQFTVGVAREGEGWTELEARRAELAKAAAKREAEAAKVAQEAAAAEAEAEAQDLALEDAEERDEAES
ncbi:MAG: 50S ribosomal protein L9 [Litorilinea sp.]